MTLATETAMATATATRPRPIDGQVALPAPQTAERCCPPVAAPTLTEGQAEEYAGWFQALADPTRVRILNLLASSPEPVCVCDITPHFNLKQPAISHHLKVLKEVCFITAERRGTFMYYAVNHACIAGFPEAARRIMGA